MFFTQLEEGDLYLGGLVFTWLYIWLYSCPVQMLVLSCLTPLTSSHPGKYFTTKVLTAQCKQLALPILPEQIKH